jgi:hypothetical protein
MPPAPPSFLVLRWWACLAAAWLLAAGSSPAWGQVARESAVKAAFLSKFPDFVEWPAGTFQRPDGPLVIGVFGNEPVASDLEQILAARPGEGRPVLVRRLREGDVAPGVHVLMIGATREARVRELAQAAVGPVLVVTEQEAGLRLGGVLNFHSDAGRVRFSASLPAAEARNLRLSARLLAVAQSVERGR